MVKVFVFWSLLSLLVGERGGGGQGSQEHEKNRAQPEEKGRSRALENCNENDIGILTLILLAGEKRAMESAMGTYW